MQYYINPMWFYWLSVFDSIKNVCLMLSCFIGIGAFVILGIYISDDFFFDNEIFRAGKQKSAKRCLKALWIVFSVCLICWMLIPSEKTIIAMMIAKQAAVYNDQNLLDAIKNAVDYVIQAIQNAK